MSIVIQNILIWNPNEAPKRGDLQIEGGTFVKDIMEKENLTMINGQSFIAMPGFIDLHIHGAMGGDVMDATPEALETISKALVEEGTTAFLATTITQSEENIARALQNAASLVS